MINTAANSSIRIIDNTYFSIGFPNEDWDQLINRENYLSQIDDYLKTGVKILFIDGDEDSGKTILCAQFARRNVEQTITVFFNPLNNLDFEINFYCSNVVSQIKNILNENGNYEGKEKGFISIEEYQQYIFQLRKFLHKDNRKINLVIDGLEEKLTENPEFITQLFSIMPFGQDIFRIVISGNENKFTSINPKLKGETIKLISLTGFAPPEIIEYLKLPKPTNTELKDLYQVTKGFPGRLKTLKRLIEKENYSLEQISSTTTYQTWLELDCGSVNLNLPLNNGILSLLALIDQTFTIDEIAKICSVENQLANDTIENLSILELSGKFVSYVSTAHKRYFANILRGNRKKTQDLLINFYANNSTINSLIELPKLYAEKNDWPKIIDILDDDYPKKIIESTGSLKNLNDSLALGVKASEKMNRYTEMWRYSLKGSILNEMDNYLFWESEIKARISIDDFAGAISLAECAVLNVDRLKLMALIARKEKESKNAVDEDLINLIQNLYQITDLSSVGDKIYEIVADLIYAIPNLAIEMIEKISGNTSEKNINDWIIAKLSLAAIDSSFKENENIENSKKLEAVESLNAPLVKKINKSISFLVGNYTSAKVLEEVNKLSDSKEKLRLLRLWLNNNRTNLKNVEDVVGMALNELIKSSSETSITLDVLKELSYQLPYVKDLKIKKELYQRFKSIEDNLSDLGLTKNKYIYQLNIFHTEFTFDRAKSIRTLNLILKEIDAITDILIKLDSYSEVFSKLKILHNADLDNKISFVYSRILILSKELFDSTANHFKISQYVLKTIGKRSPSLGLKISDQINTISRRDKSKLLILDSYLDNNLKKVNIEKINEIENSLELPSSKDKLYSAVLERYAEAKSLHFNTINSLFYYKNKIDLFQNINKKVFGNVLFYKILFNNHELKTRFSKKLEKQIYSDWDLIEAEWNRVDTGFNICSHLAKINPDFAKEIFAKSEKLKSESWLDSSLVAVTFLNSVQLILRAYKGLLISENENKDDYKIIQDLIARIPSEIEKLKLWTELGFHTNYAKKEILMHKILDDHIIPLTLGLIEAKMDVSKVLDSFTLIHLYNSDMSIRFLNAVPIEKRLDAFNKICDYYITGRNPFEIYEYKSFKNSASFSDLSKAVDVLNHLDTDVDIYFQISNISKTIIENKISLSRAQVATLVDSLDIIIKSKLPDKRNIKHQGYKLLAEMKITKLKKDYVNNKVYWSKLIEDANLIPNISDSIFVKSILLEDLPFEKIPNGSEVKGKLYNDIISNLNSLKIHYEFVQRVIDISDTMYAINRTKWKEVVATAFAISADLNEGSEAYNSQKNIIDSMYRLDPAYAKELIKFTDKDNNKNKISKLLQNHFEALEISKKIKNNQALDEKEKENFRNVIRGIIESIRALNSERINTKKISEVSIYLPIGNKLPLHEVFPIYEYYLNNCALTYRKKNLEGSLADLHRKNFKEAVLATNLIQLLSQRRKINEQSYRKFFIDEDFATNEIVKPGTREEALNFIKNWLKDEVEDFIIIADPYFKKEDLEILKIIKEVKPNVEIDILGSKNGTTNNIEFEFKEFWKKISDELPPFSNITFCWIPEQNNQTPFHDRWIITKNGGIRLGTSLNSMGMNKESELSVMKPNDALNIKENILLEYIRRKKKEINNMRISYKSFTL